MFFVATLLLLWIACRACSTTSTESKIKTSTLPNADQVPCSEPDWKRIAFINVTDPKQKCPPGLNHTVKPASMCGRAATGDYVCNSTYFSVGGQKYSRVCGRIEGYQYGSTFSFLLYFNYTGYNTIEKAYLDGVSLTHGKRGKRQHIWSFASAYNQIETNSVVFCPTDNSTVPPFVGKDYFCDSGYAGTGFGGYVYHTDDPLWDGKGCDADAQARCKTNNPPWFTKVLSDSTTDDIELRICAGNGVSDSDTPLNLIELYIQ